MSMLRTKQTKEPGAGEIGAVQPAAIDVDDVSLVHNSRTADSFCALDSVSFSVKRGEFVSLVGPSGCGKSTLLTMLAGLGSPTSGVVRLEGTKIEGVQRHAGFVFQKDSLLPWRTAVENVELPLRFRGVPKRQRRTRALDALASMGLSGFGDRYPHQLSGGQRKRVAIAATLVYEPSVLLMDEPFAALDVQTRDIIENDILRAWDERGDQTVVFVTHDLEEAIALSDRVLVMTASPGRMLADYRVDLARPRDILEVKMLDDFTVLHRRIWDDLKVEVLKAQQSTFVKGTS